MPPVADAPTTPPVLQAPQCFWVEGRGPSAKQCTAKAEPYSRYCTEHREYGWKGVPA